MFWNGYQRRVEGILQKDQEFTGLKNLLAQTAKSTTVEIVFTQCHGAFFARDFARIASQKPCRREVFEAL